MREGGGKKSGRRPYTYGFPLTQRTPFWSFSKTGKVNPMTSDQIKQFGRLFLPWYRQPLVILWAIIIVLFCVQVIL